MAAVATTGSFQPKDIKFYNQNSNFPDVCFCNVKGESFAIIHKEMQVNGRMNLNDNIWSKMHVINLADLKAGDITIECVHYIGLGKLIDATGEVNIKATSTATNIGVKILVGKAGAVMTTRFGPLCELEITDAKREEFIKRFTDAITTIDGQKLAATISSLRQFIVTHRVETGHVNTDPVANIEAFDTADLLTPNEEKHRLKAKIVKSLTVSARASENATAAAPAITATASAATDNSQSKNNK